VTTEGTDDEGIPAVDQRTSLRRVPGADFDEDFAHPTAAMVLHRVLAGAARTFLLNDMGDELLDDTKRCETVGALNLLMHPRPLWAQSATTELDGTGRRATESERIHQSRVALRRIRSNLRTFRLLVDPVWGTSLRAELAWYGSRLGEARDLHNVREMIRATGPTVIDPEQVARLESVVTARMATALTQIGAERGGARRFQLTEQMMVVWDGLALKAKAGGPAVEVLPPMLHRAWQDLRGASRAARNDTTAANLHKLRIRLKNLRYGCETLALIEGGSARKTAKAAEGLQTRLGDVHDALYSIDWLRSLAVARPDLTDPINDLVAAQRRTAAVIRKGWKRDLKEVERRWRRWQRS
jgi:CHAD domain-containing protein